MSGIPTIPGSAQVPDVQIGTKRNPQARIQALGQLRRTAQEGSAAIQDVMGSIAQYEEKKRKAEEAFVFNASSLSFQKLHTQFLHGVKQMPDEQIVLNWSAQTQAWRQGQLDQYGAKLSPKAKTMFQMNMDQAIGGSTAKFQVVADALGSQRRESAAVANAQEFLKSGDPAMMAKANTSLGLAVKAGDMTPEKAGEYSDQFPQRLAVAQASNMVPHAPGMAIKKIESGGWPEIRDTKQREALVRLAHAQQDDNLRNLLLTKRNPLTGDIEEKDLNPAMESGDIDPKAGRALLDTQKRDEARDDAAERRAFEARIHDSAAWHEDPDKYAHDLRNDLGNIRNPTIQKEVSDSIDRELASVKKTGTTSELPVHRTQLDFMRNISNERMGAVPTGNRNQRAAPYIEGGAEKVKTMSDADFKAAFGHNANRTAVVRSVEAYEESERAKLANAEQEYRDWSKTKKGAEATPQEAADMRERLGYGQYNTATDVKAALQAGKIDRAMAKEILANQFGLQ
jgi:hypothetical protein